MLVLRLSESMLLIVALMLVAVPVVLSPVHNRWRMLVHRSQRTAMSRTLLGLKETSDLQGLPASGNYAPSLRAAVHDCHPEQLHLRLSG